MLLQLDPRQPVADLASQATHLFAQFWEPPILIMLPALILTLVLAPVAFSTLADQSLSEALLSTGLATFYFTAALTASIVTYRLFFHRLRSFPGPRMAAATKFWNMALCVEGRTPWAIAEEHRKHGDIVRIVSCYLISSHLYSLQGSR